MAGRALQSLSPRGSHWSAAKTKAQAPENGPSPVACVFFFTRTISWSTPTAVLYRAIPIGNIGLMKLCHSHLSSQAFICLLILLVVNSAPAGESTAVRPHPTNASTPTPTLPSDMDRAKNEDYTAALLDRLQQHLEEWGVITISDPLLLPVGDDFDLGTSFPTATDYINSESTSINAAATQVTQNIVVGQLSGSEQLSGSSPKSTTSSANNGATSGSGTGQGDTGATLPKLNAKDFLAQQAFAAPGTLVPATTSIARRDAVNNGIGDKLTELALRLQANPSKLKDGLKRYFLIFQVTCNPGWRTLKGYMGDLQVQFEYARNDRGVWMLSLSQGGRRQPHIIAALPLMDAQNIELRNSERDLQSLSLALSAAGPNALGSASGKALLDYIKSYQSDASSRQALPVVNSYSSGTIFGFRFSPSFLALGNPAKKHSNSENQLVPTAFPVVLLIAINPSDLYSDRGRYTNLVSQYAYHWMLKDHDFSVFPWKMPKRREDERARLQLARDVDNALTTLIDAYPRTDKRDPVSRAYEQGKINSPVYRMLRQDYYELEEKSVGRMTIVDLPSNLLGATALPPHVKSIIPKVIDPDMDTVVVIEGSNFSQNPKAVVIGGRQCPIISSTESNIVAQVSKGVLADGRFFEPDGSFPTDGKADVVVLTEAGPSQQGEDARLTVRAHDNGMRKFILVHDSDTHAQAQPESPQAAADQAAADQAAADQAAADRAPADQLAADQAAAAKAAADAKTAADQAAVSKAAAAKAPADPAAAAKATADQVAANQATAAAKTAADQVSADQAVAKAADAKAEASKAADKAAAAKPIANPPPAAVNISVGSIVNTPATSAATQQGADKNQTGQSASNKTSPDQKNHDQTTFEFRERGKWQDNEKLIDATANIMGSPSKTSGTGQTTPGKTPASAQ
jgi:hypothetical protein